MSGSLCHYRDNSHENCIVMEREYCIPPLRADRWGKQKKCLDCFKYFF